MWLIGFFQRTTWSDEGNGYPGYLPGLWWNAVWGVKGKPSSLHIITRIVDVLPVHGLGDLCPLSGHDATGCAQSFRSLPEGEYHVKCNETDKESAQNSHSFHGHHSFL